MTWRDCVREGRRGTVLEDMDAVDVQTMWGAKDDASYPAKPRDAVEQTGTYRKREWSGNNRVRRTK